MLNPSETAKKFPPMPLFEDCVDKYRRMQISAKYLFEYFVCQFYFPVIDNLDIFANMGWIIIYSFVLVWFFFHSPVVRTQNNRKLQI